MRLQIFQLVFFMLAIVIHLVKSLIIEKNLNYLSTNKSIYFIIIIF